MRVESRAKTVMAACRMGGWLVRGMLRSMPEAVGMWEPFHWASQVGAAVGEGGGESWEIVRVEELVGLEGGCGVSAARRS